MDAGLTTSHLYRDCSLSDTLSMKRPDLLDAGFFKEIIPMLHHEYKDFRECGVVGKGIDLVLILAPFSHAELRLF